MKSPEVRHPKSDILFTDTDKKDAASLVLRLIGCVCDFAEGSGAPDPDSFWRSRHPDLGPQRVQSVKPLRRCAPDSPGSNRDCCERWRSQDPPPARADSFEWLLPGGPVAPAPRPVRPELLHPSASMPGPVRIVAPPDRDGSGQSA